MHVAATSVIGAKEKIDVMLLKISINFAKTEVSEFEGKSQTLENSRHVA